MYVRPVIDKKTPLLEDTNGSINKEEKEPHGPLSPSSSSSTVRQRGIYSEYLGRSTRHAEREATSGPRSPSHTTLPAIVQRPPKASTFTLSSADTPQTSPDKKRALAREPTRTSTRPRLEPKVIVPYQQRPGKPPRRIEIERKKRLYASQDLEKLLRSVGVDYTRYGIDMDHATGTPSYLPLEIFDDTEYECRSPEEWVELGMTDDETKNVCAPGKGLRFDDDFRGQFVPCDMIGWDATEEKFIVRWRDNGRKTSLFRIHLYFDAENPFDFVQRVATAHRSRRAFEASIRYSLYVDSMPTDEISPLDTEQVNRILLLSLNTKKLKQNALDTTTLLNEVNIDYARTMNKIIFDVNLKDPAQAALKQTLALTDPAATSVVPKKPVPYLGVVKVAFHDFPKHFSDFCFHSFFTKIEAITALVKVNGECLRLNKMNVFNTAISKSVRLEEFEQLQNSSMLQLSSFLKDKWTNALKNCIKHSLRDVGKGWLNLQEKNREVYQFSKLKKFMTMVNFMMQDSLRFLVEDSTHKYATFLHNTSRYRVTVNDTYDVQVVVVEEDDNMVVAPRNTGSVSDTKDDGEDKNDENKSHSSTSIPISLTSDDTSFQRIKDFSLFSVDLVLKEGVIQYTTAPSQFHATPLMLFDKALLMLHDIPQLETYVMEHLFWYGNEAKLACVRREEPWVQSLYDGISARLTTALNPMNEYLQKFHKYDELIALNVDDYVKEFASLDNDVEDIRKEIMTQIRAKQQIETEIPKSVWLGLVIVNCEDVRRKLSSKYSDIITKELDYFAKLTKNRCDEINKNFKKIETELKRQPEDIQQLTKLKEYMGTIPLTVASYREPIREAMESFDVLEAFSYRLPKDMFRLKWQTFGWPKAIHDQMEFKELNLASEKQVFLNEMRQQQEEFTAELLEVEKRVNTFGQYSDMEKVAKIAEKCIKIHEKIEDLQNRARAFNGNEVLFNLNTTDYRHVTKVAKNFEPYYQLWTTASEWLKNHESWMSDSFLELNGDNIANQVMTYNKTMSKCLKSKAIKDNPGCLVIATSIKKEIESFRPLLPLIIALRNPGMRDRHWEMLSGKLPFEFHPDDTMTLTRVVDEFKLQNYLEIITKVGESAGKEYQIESSLQKMEDSWRGVEFEILPYKKTGTYVVKGVDDTISLLDEHIVTTQAMLFSPYKKVFDDRITRWGNKLNLVYEVIEEWLLVQRQWLSLQAIFQSPDINKQLPAEGKRFASVNKTWRLIMSQVHANPDVLSFADNPGLLQKLQDSNKLLNMVQKRLSDYLDKKRSAFARFFFLANDELLQILSQTQDPTAVQPHLKKCFENINRLHFTERDSLITAMFSAEDEEVKFVKALDPKKKNVEHWLGEVETAMKEAVRSTLGASVKDYAVTPRNSWVKKWPGQCVLNGSQIHWTMEVESALRSDGARGLERYYHKQLAQLTAMVELVRGDLTPIQRLTMGALIVLDVHARDVIEKLVNEKTSSPADFQWMMQMRYYQDAESEGNQLWVQMVQSRFPYGYEYLGNTLRLVITPLTDRCYITLMTALQLHLGGSPAGPAGTGKTETVKDLAKAVAKQCVVFNCSDGLNYLAMGKFFKGLASSGAWACFDEFNRIDIEVLSVVAQQIMTIWEAVREGVKHFIFEETPITLEPTCSVFITMNPGYAGRTELPDNLKALFRSVSMMVPDYTMIAEIMLYSFGFNNAKLLARKMTCTFKLASEQLSAQDHYDYGMRAVKTTITRAGTLFAEQQHAQGKVDDEEQLLLRALMDVNIPKFLKTDLPLFEGIIHDLFPHVTKPEPDYGALMNSLILTCKEDGLQPVDSFLDKCIQLYDTFQVRHGLMLVGPTGGGKTTSIRTLKKAITRLKTLPAYSRVKDYTLNPKAVTMGQLYGESDPHTREWTDGILAQIVRDCIDDTSSTKKWVIFDGPVDALWIENMNTVLDDNKKLCLVSGEILQLTPTMTMVFEVEDLAVASPATVSRCGMVYMEPSAMGTSPLVKSYLDRLHKVFIDIRKPLGHLFDTMLDTCIAFIRRTCSEPVPSVDNNLCRSLMNILDCIFAPYIPVEGMPRTEENEQALLNLKSHIEPIFILALIWSVGATVDKHGRQRFSSWLRLFMSEIGLKEVPPLKGLLYDYIYDLQQQRWLSWIESQPAYHFDDRLTYSEIIVPTLDSIRYSYLLDLLSKQGKHVLFTGSTGTGKTVNVFQYLSTLPNDMIPINIIFSAATTANQTEDILFGKMVKRRQRVWGPPLGKKMIVFIDDMNMPAREKYFAQPPIELLRQWMDHGGWFDRKTLSFVDIVDISFIAAMGPPGGGRNPVTPRFLRHFNQIAHTELENDSLQLIFETIVENCLTKFPDTIRAFTSKMVTATIDVYQTVSRELLPSPNKSHYTFNLRDLSAVFQGILSASSKRVIDVPTFLRLWIHENRRVFKDRLINDTDRNYLDTLLANCMKQHLDATWEETMPADGLCLFGDYLDGIAAEVKMYAEVREVERATRVMEECLAEYNDENTPMKLVMFPSAVEHVSRISRVLRQPGGNALLLGVGGSGRQSLTKLATFMAEYELFQVEVTKNYGITEWHADLKRLLLDAGLKEQPTVFLFSDTQIVHESFFNDINNILNSGEVPNLYSNEDMDNIFATCKIECQRKNIPATKINAYTQFINRVRTNLHVVFCMSPIGNQFRTRLRMFPALVNCCTIDWFSDWSQADLALVSTSSLTEEELKLDNIPAVVSMFGVMHSSVTEKSLQYQEELRRYNYVTPTSYLELLNVFKFLLQEKRAEVGGLRGKLQYGLDTLHSASEDVAKLQVDLTEKQPRLVETQHEVEETMAQILIDKKDAAVTKEIVEKQEAEAAAKAAECKQIRDEAQAELDRALPMLDKAVECLRELNKSHIDEVRNFKKPPSGVILTMEAACIMLRDKLKLKIVMKQDANSMIKRPDYWETAQKYLLKQPKTLLETLKKYDKNNIPDKMIAKIKPYISREDFSVKRVETASVACRAICMWVHAMYNYYNVDKMVQPKRVRLKSAEEELEKVMISLNDAKDRLSQVQDRLKALTDKHENLVAESESLLRGVEMCQVKLERATKLIGGLGGEKDRWQSTVQRLDAAYNNIVGDVLVSAGTIAYLGAFSASYRSALTEQWRTHLKALDVPHTEGCSIRSTLADPVQIRAWNIAGLPTDSVSTENGIIMSKARRWPLMIDPQMQAAKFIKKLGQQKFEEGMDIVKLSDKNFLHAMENAIRFGKWVLLENVMEELDPALEPLLLQQIINVKGVPHIRLGDNAIPYNDQFHLYITTKLPNPKFAPELQVKVTLLNFTITPEGLQDQMLGTVVARESPELEQKKNALVVQNARMKKQLQDTEDQILRMLSEVKGDILEDEELINTLAASKKTSEEINERVVETEVVEKDIDIARRAYAPVAVRASILYFCIADLAMIDPMYQYSLQWFVNLFVAGIGNAPASQDPVERLKNLNDYFTKSLYENVCRSLFEAHKMLFSFLLTVKILQGQDRIKPTEWRYLVAGAPPTKSLPNPAPDWLTENVWNNILSLSQLEQFAGFEIDFITHLRAFKTYFDSQDPQNESLPEPWNTNLDSFQKMLVLKVLRPDKMTPAIQAFVAEHLGPEFNEAPQFSLAHSYKDASPTTPLIFILSSGADPASKLFAFANEMGFRDKITSISLGQGQGVIAERHIEEAMKKGGWVLLQNAHLAISWLPTLERICAEMKAEETHDDFRLWLTSLPTNKFPVSILQNGVKMTNEPPKGLRANLQRSYLGFTDHSLNKSKRPREFKKLLFALCFFHAVVLDRRKFGPLGWNIEYQFTENDLGVCVTQLRDFIDLYADLPFKTIHFLTYDINYGGRVTDDVDRRTISTILDDFINPRVLSDDYQFSSSGKYTSIPTGTRDHYLKYIATMDAIPSTDIFGLHENANITSAQEETNRMFSTVLTLLPRSSATGEKSREVLISETAASILDKLPSTWEIDAVIKKYPTAYSESMNTVLVQETIRYNRLLNTMRQSLIDLRRCLRGEMVMTESLEEMADSLYNNVVPELWNKVAYPSLMPLAAWVNDLQNRVNFIGKWIDDGIPNVFWISGFFFPQAFLTGTLQNYARKTSKAIDSISFGFHVLDKKPEAITERPKDGIYIHGLHLEGARWDPARASLVDSRPKELFTPFPVMWLLPEQDRKEPETGVYKCPVYKTLTRAGQLSTTGHSTNFVLFVEIPSSAPRQKWIKAGVALFCALRY